MLAGAHAFPNRQRLACAAALSVCTSFVLQCISLATKWWVHIQWRFNSTFYFKTDLGLWQKCEIVTESVKNLTIGQNQICSYDLMNDMTRAPDLKNMHIIAICAPVAALFMTISGGFTVLLNDARRKPASQLIASVLFIFTGMLSLTGFIVFIDHASEEISNKKNTALQSGAQIDTEFDYGYGISLLMFGTSVMFSEFSGFAYGAFYLHFYRYRYVQKLPQFAVDENGDPIDSETLEDQIAICTSRALDEMTASAVNSRLNSYRAPSRSCSDLTKSDDDHDHRHQLQQQYKNQYQYQYQGQHQLVDKKKNHSLPRRTREAASTVEEGEGQLVKSKSSGTARSVWQIYDDEKGIIDLCKTDSASEIRYPARSASTLYSRITEV